MKLSRILTSLLLTALFLLALALPAAAAGPVYDPDDGTPQPAPADENMVWLSDSMAFNKQTREFVYPVGESGTTVQASVANGMIVTNPVKITGVTLLIYRNGDLWEGDPSSISEPGEYVVMAQTGNKTPRLFTFTLVGKSTSTVYSYNLPAGMIVTDATRDELPTDYDRTVVPMQDDGLYHVVYQCISTGMTYELDLEVDRTPPDVHFDGQIDENHRVHSALRFSNLQRDETLQATLDGAQIQVSVNPDGTGELTDSGYYIIYAYDAAGNRSEYGYTVMLYFNSGALAFFLILAAALIALGVYILYKRRHLEIG